MTTVEQTPPLLDSPFAPEADDDDPPKVENAIKQEEEEEPMDVSGETHTSQTNGPEENQTENDESNKLAENVKQLRVSRVQECPKWTNDELYRLMEACELPKSWELRVQTLVEEFGKNHEDNFFTVESCQEKYKRLTGESENKPANKDLLSWIKQFLKRAFNERHAHGESARLARVRRFYELTMHALNDRLTEDQISELVGIDLYNDFVNNKLTEPNREGREEWLHADLFSSKLSHEEWKNARNPEDLINKLRTQPINKSRLHFQHHPYKIKLLEEMGIEKEKSPIIEKASKSVDESASIRSPAARRNEALASVDSADQSIDSSGKSPQRKRRRKESKVSELINESERPQQIQIKRENESPEVVIYEPNVTIVASPTRTQAISQTTTIVPGVESETTETSKRQLRQRKSSEEKQSSTTVSSDLTKIEIKREDSVDVQPMEVDENLPIAKQETLESTTQTILSIRQIGTNKRAEAKSEMASTRTSRRSQAASKKSSDKSPTPSTTTQSQTPLPQQQQPLTIRCRHSETQTETLDSKQLQNQLIIFTDAKIEDEYVVKLEEKILSYEANKKESPKTTATPNAPARRGRKPAHEKESKTKDVQQLKISPKSQVVALLTDEQTMSEIYPEVRLPEPEEPVEEQPPTKGKAKDQNKERATPARRSRRSGVASQEETTEPPKPIKKSPPESPIQFANIQSTSSIAQEPIPGPVTPNQKTLLLSAHNLVIGHPKANEFRDRVTDEVVSGYSDVVKHPMDLNTIRTLIDENKIKTLTELYDHYLLMCMNAIMFNDDGHTVNQDARELKLFCSQTIQNMRHPTARKAAQRLSSRRQTTGGRGSSSIAGGSGARPFIQSGAPTNDSQSNAIRRTFIHSSSYHRARKIKVPPIE